MAKCREEDIVAFLAIELWDLKKHKKAWQSAPQDLQVTYHRIAFSPQSDLFASWGESVHGTHLRIFELDSLRERLAHSVKNGDFGLRIWKQDPRERIWKLDPGAAGASGVFSPDGSLFMLCNNSEKLLMFDVRAGNLLWEQLNLSNAVFTRDSSSVLRHDTESGQLELLDARTGIRRRSCAPGLKFEYFHSVDGQERFAAFAGTHIHRREPYRWEQWLQDRWPKVFTDKRVAVIDMDTGAEHYRLCHDDAQVFVVSEQGDVLVTSYSRESPDRLLGTSVIQVWDMHAARAWFWAIAWMSITGGLLLLLAAGGGCVSPPVRHSWGVAKRLFAFFNNGNSKRSRWGRSMLSEKDSRPLFFRKKVSGNNAVTLSQNPKCSLLDVYGNSLMPAFRLGGWLMVMRLKLEQVFLVIDNELLLGAHRLFQHPPGKLDDLRRHLALDGAVAGRSSGSELLEFVRHRRKWRHKNVLMVQVGTWLSNVTQILISTGALAVSDSVVCHPRRNDVTTQGINRAVTQLWPCPESSA
jgi:hypothetical protein